MRNDRPPQRVGERGDRPQGGLDLDVLVARVGGPAETTVAPNPDLGREGRREARDEGRRRRVGQLGAWPPGRRSPATRTSVDLVVFVRPTQIGVDPALGGSGRPASPAVKASPQAIGRRATPRRPGPSETASTHARREPSRRRAARHAEAHVGEPEIGERQPQDGRTRPTRARTRSQEKGRRTQTVVWPSPLSRTRARRNALRRASSRAADGLEHGPVEGEPLGAGEVLQARREVERDPVVVVGRATSPKRHADPDGLGQRDAPRLAPRHEGRERRAGPVGPRDDLGHERRVGGVVHLPQEEVAVAEVLDETRRDGGEEVEDRAVRPRHEVAQRHRPHALAGRGEAADVVDQDEGGAARHGRESLASGAPTREAGSREEGDEHPEQRQRPREGGHPRGDRGVEGARSVDERHVGHELADEVVAQAGE